MRTDSTVPSGPDGPIAPSLVSAEHFNTVLRETVPLAVFLGIEAEDISAERALLRLPWRAEALRPGGAVGGPALMALADIAMYAAVMGATGDGRPLTTNLSINFLRRVPSQDLLASCMLIASDDLLMVGSIEIAPAGGGDIVAHCTCTYAVPPRI